VPADLPERPRHSFQRRRLRYDATFRTLAGYAEEHGLPYSAVREWANEDKAILLAVQLEKAQRCPMCGTSEWEHQENPGGFTAVLNTCPGCKIKDEKREEIEGSLPSGTHVQLVPTEVAERLSKTRRVRPRSPRERARRDRSRR
jgi:hypothetical protein